ncbi:hypothetical protein KIPB_000240 [Kipferlia bialata]|uniref:Nudix hydrolase domain-containing protein n=1 Tax=Kipferlia bialata TaxID=797122 RepID=A0A9K3CN41_9EUKA|nr:hypothetical protein KIPB_000240 [Kipferlia bialata]|eukprot:g240.t1
MEVQRERRKREEERRREREEAMQKSRAAEESEKERAREREKRRAMQKSRAAEKERETERKREKERQIQIAAQREREKERQMQIAAEREREKERQIQIARAAERGRENERQRQIARAAEREREKERQTQIARAAEREREKERQRQGALAAEREREEERNREGERQMQMQRARAAEREREKELQMQIAIAAEREREKCARRNAIPPGITYLPKRPAGSGLDVQPASKRVISVPGVVSPVTQTVKDSQTQSSTVKDALSRDSTLPPAAPHVTICADRSYWRGSSLVVVPSLPNKSVPEPLRTSIYKEMPYIFEGVAEECTGKLKGQGTAIHRGCVSTSHPEGVTVIHAPYLRFRDMQMLKGEAYNRLRTTIHDVLEAARELGAGTVTLPRLADVRVTKGNAESQPRYHYALVTAVRGFLEEEKERDKNGEGGMQIRIVEHHPLAIESLRTQAATLGLTVLDDPAPPTVKDPVEPKMPPAGILPVREVEGVRQVLLSVEKRQWKNYVLLHVLGGKGEVGETTRQTAVREFWEETGKTLSSEDVEGLLPPSVEPVYVPEGKYTLFSMWVPPGHMLNTLPDTFTPSVEVCALVWCPLDALLKSVEKKKKGGKGGREGREGRERKACTFPSWSDCPEWQGAMAAYSPVALYAR